MILSAGVLGLPYILTLSGIDPSQHLMEFGIIVRLDLPVGKNLRDHNYGASSIFMPTFCTKKWYGNHKDCD